MALIRHDNGSLEFTRVVSSTANIDLSSHIEPNLQAANKAHMKNASGNFPEISVEDTYARTKISVDAMKKAFKK